MFRSTMATHTGIEGTTEEEGDGDILTTIPIDGIMVGVVEDGTMAGTMAGAVATAVGVAITPGDMILISVMDGETITTIGDIVMAIEMGVGITDITPEPEDIIEIERRTEIMAQEALYTQGAHAQLAI